MKTDMTKRARREKRRARVRARVFGTLEKPRLNVHRSLLGMYVQLIDDVRGRVIVSAHSKTAPSSGDAGERKGKTAQAYLLGFALAEKAKAAGVASVVFDRAGYKYHGRVKALAEGARDGGLAF